MLLASGLAVEQQKWRVVQELPHPLLSPALAKLQQGYSESCSLLLESPDCRRNLWLLFRWGALSASLGTLRPATPLTSDGTVRGESWKSRDVTLQDMTGSNIRDKLTSLFAN